VCCSKRFSGAKAPSRNASLSRVPCSKLGGRYGQNHGHQRLGLTGAILAILLTLALRKFFATNSNELDPASVLRMSRGVSHWACLAR
jgi:hypothetical protein